MATEENAEGDPQLLLPFRPHPSPAAIGKLRDELSAQAFELVGSLFGIPQPTHDEQLDIVAHLSELHQEYAALVEGDADEQFKETQDGLEGRRHRLANVGGCNDS